MTDGVRHTGSTRPRLSGAFDASAAWLVDCDARHNYVEWTSFSANRGNSCHFSPTPLHLSQLIIKESSRVRVGNGCRNAYVYKLNVMIQCCSCEISQKDTGINDMVSEDPSTES